MNAEPPLTKLATTLDEHLGRVSRELDDMRAEIAAIAAEREEPQAPAEPALPQEPPIVAAVSEPVIEPPAEPIAPVSAPVAAPTELCPSCGAAVLSDALFCISCGARLAEEEPAAVPVPPPKPVTAPLRELGLPLAPRPEPQPSRLTLAYRRWRGDLGWLEFFGRRVLVWIAGIVIVIGMVLLYRHAVQAGWIGPAARTVLGTALSVGLLVAAGAVRSRLRSDEGALAAAGAGIAGLYASLYAAVEMYHLIGTTVGLPLTLAIGALAVVIALRWSAQPLAVLGLAGAGLAPLLVSRGVDPASAAFVTVVAGAGAILWVQRSWLVAFATSTAVSLPQAIVLLAHAHGTPMGFGWTLVWQTVLVAAAYWLVYEVALAAYRRGRPPELDPVSALVATGAVAFALLSAAVIFTGDPRGYAMLAVGGVYLAVTAFFGVAQPGQRDLMTVSWAAALSAVSVGVMILLGGATRAVVLAIEGGLHVYLAGRLREPRLQLSAIAHLVLAAGFALALAPPSALVSYPDASLLSHGAVATDLIRASLFSVLAVAAGGIAFLRWHRPAYVWSRAEAELVTFWVVVVTALYAISTAVIDSFLWYTASQRSFENGHTLVSVAWAVIGFGLMYAGFRRHTPHVRIGGLVLFVAALGKLFLFDLARLEAMARAVSFLAVGLILLASGIVYRELSLRESGRDRPGPPFGAPPAGTAAG